jgi:hypothetical protein
MSQLQVERRRAPRVTVSGHRMMLSANLRVRVVDISVGGVLMACSSAVPGDGTLFLGLGGAPFIAELRVRPAPSGRALGSPPLVGAAFVRMDATSRQALEAFLLKAKD